MLAPLAIWPITTPTISAITAGAAILAIAPLRDAAPTSSTGLPSLTMTISGARWTVPTAAIAFIAANGSSAALGITGWGGGGGASPGGGPTPPAGPFGLPAAAPAVGGGGFFRPRPPLGS